MMTMPSLIVFMKSSPNNTILSLILSMSCRRRITSLFGSDSEIRHRTSASCKKLMSSPSPSFSPLTNFALHDALATVPKDMSDQDDGSDCGPSLPAGVLRSRGGWAGDSLEIGKFKGECSMRCRCELPAM